MSGARRDATVTFRCNVCGRWNQKPAEVFGREMRSCDGCGSSVRMRGMVRALTFALFGKSRALPDLEVDRSIRGVGLSDWRGYAEPLARIFDYTNTRYDTEPRLDIRQPPAEWCGKLDFVLSTDVFEHVDPPVVTAFEGARRLLKPGGALVFSVPYTLQPDTQEHFPELHDWRLEERDGEQVLVNVTAGGERQEFRDLCFHGGPGQTLEMRVFSLDGLRRSLREAGFAEPVVMSDSDIVHGVLQVDRWSLPMVARPELSRG
jgi:SAM-dependent methyltransferase